MSEMKMPECGLNEGQRSCCALATAMDFLGDKWSVVLLRDMIIVGKQEYKQFLESPERIASNVLSARLKTFQEIGIITRHAHPAGGKRVLYCLTDRGLALLPTLIELSLWSEEHLENTWIPPQFKDLMLRDRGALITEINERVIASRIV